MMCAVFTVYFIIVHIITSNISAQAPGDADAFCTSLSGTVALPSYPPNTRILMDSYHYIHLLPSLPGISSAWQKVDVDNKTDTNGGRTNWYQERSFACRQPLFSCYFNVGGQNNWLITQHISRVVNGSLLPQVSVQIEFQHISCSSGCQMTFLLKIWETSTIDRDAARITSNYRRIMKVSPISKASNGSHNASISIDFESPTADGFYIAIVDEDTCITLSRVIIFYHVCPEITFNLTRYPETLSPPLNKFQSFVVTGECVDNATGELQGRNSLLSCNQGGVWGVVKEGTRCACISGYIQVEETDTCLQIERTAFPTTKNEKFTMEEFSVISSQVLLIIVIAPLFVITTTTMVIIFVGIILSYLKRRRRQSFLASNPVNDVPLNVEVKAVKMTPCDAYGITTRS